MLPKLLLFLARETLTTEQKDFVMQVDFDRIDLAMLVAECGNRMIAATAFSHFLALGVDATGTHASTWKTVTKQQAMSSMLHASELRRFHQDCIEPLSIRHIYVKGPVLAARYYEQPFLRQCRDVDVLIGKERVAEVVKRAIDLGYSLADPRFETLRHRGKEAENAFIELTEVVTLRSPNGIFIEVHRSLDRQFHIFQTENLFANSDTGVFWGCNVQVLKPELEFCYIVYHATHHTWAKLSWFTDMHNILAQPYFDRADCLGHAETLGLGALVSACMELDDWICAGASSVAVLSPGARRIFELYLRNVGGDLSVEKELILSEHTIGLPRRFQASRMTRTRAFFSHLQSSLTPGIEFYCRYPLPMRYWWLYRLVRPIVSVGGFIRMKLASRPSKIAA